jgi:hypothetical protein
MMTFLSFKLNNKNLEKVLSVSFFILIFEIDGWKANL